MMSIMHPQINRANSSAIDEKVIPEIHNMRSLPLRNGDVQASSSSNSQENRENTTGLKPKFSKKDFRFAFDLGDIEDRSP